MVISLVPRQNGQDVREHLSVVTADTEVCEASFFKKNTKNKFDGSILHFGISW